MGTGVQGFVDGSDDFVEQASVDLAEGRCIVVVVELPETGG